MTRFELALEALPALGLLLIATAAGLYGGLRAFILGLGVAFVAYWLMLHFLGGDGSVLTEPDADSGDQG